MNIANTKDMQNTNLEFLQLTKESELFDVTYYLQQYPDVKKAGVDALVHYLEKGANEGRNPNKNFNTNDYIKKHPELRETALNPLVHYILYHWQETSPSLPEIVIQDETAMAAEEKIEKPILEQIKIIKDSGLFDVSFYLSISPDVRELQIDPIKHYIEYGASEGRNPNQSFDSMFYINQYPDVSKSGINPLVHYIQYGQAEKRKVHS